MKTGNGVAPSRILIIRLSSMGDILLSTPLLRQIKTAYARVEIDYVVKKRFGDLLRFNPHLHELIELDEAHLRAVRKRLQRVRYDAVLDLHHNWRSNYLRFGLKAPYVRRMHKDKFRQVCLVYGKKNRYGAVVPIPMRYLRTAAGLGIADDGCGLEIYWDARTESGAMDLLREKNFTAVPRSYLCLAPGAGFFTKRWPAEYYQRLAQMILEKSEERIVVMGGAEDRYLHALFPSGGRLLNLAGSLTLLQSAVILSRAAGLVVNDTGLMHMAAAVGTPVLAIFGSTVEELGFFPFRGKSSVMQVNKLYCRPCSHIGRKSCPEKHFRCMREIEPEQVFDQLNRLTVNRGQ